MLAVIVAACGSGSSPMNTSPIVSLTEASAASTQDGVSVINTPLAGSCRVTEPSTGPICADRPDRDSRPHRAAHGHAWPCSCLG